MTKQKSARPTVIDAGPLTDVVVAAAINDAMATGDAVTQDMLDRFPAGSKDGTTTPQVLMIKDGKVTLRDPDPVDEPTAPTKH